MDEEILRGMLQRIEKLEEKIIETGIIITRNTTVMDKFNDSIDRIQVTLEKLDSTMDGFKLNISEMNNQIVNSTNEITGMKSDLKNLTGKVAVIDDKGKIDFFLLIKDNIGKFIFGGGLLTLIFYYLDRFIDIYKIVKK